MADVTTGNVEEGGQVGGVIDSAVTGATVDSAVTGATVDSAVTGATVDSAVTGATVNNADATEWALETVTAPDAKTATGVHANYNADQANAFPGPITSPDVPRNLYATFNAAWDGGDLTIDGTDIDDNVIQELLVNNPGSTTVGVIVFKTVTAITKGAIGVAAQPASVGAHDKLGIAGSPVRALGVMSVDGLTEAATWDAGLTDPETRGFTPATLVPNGSRIYYIGYPETTAHAHAVTDAGHVHAVTDAGHVHAVTDAGHVHAVTDAGHVHAVTDAGHVHAVTDAGHVHAVTDAGHTHALS